MENGRLVLEAVRGNYQGSLAVRGATLCGELQGWRWRAVAAGGVKLCGLRPGSPCRPWPPPTSAQGCTNNADNSCTWTQPFTSARIRTKDSPVGSWKYGKVEVRAQLPKGKFLWPAIWMLPKDKVYGEWCAFRALWKIGGHRVRRVPCRNTGRRSPSTPCSAARPNAGRPLVRLTSWRRGGS